MTYFYVRVSEYKKVNRPRSVAASGGVVVVVVSVAVVVAVVACLLEPTRTEARWQHITGGTSINRRQLVGSAVIASNDGHLYSWKLDREMNCAERPVAMATQG